MISVLTPSFGYARFMAGALASTATSSIDVEHVVMDAGSTDGTVEILRGSSHPHLVWESKPDDGQSDALNKAFAQSSGSIIGWLNVDEVYLPGALEVANRTLLDESHVDVVYGDAVFVDEQGRILRLLAGYRHNLVPLRWRGCVISTCSTFMRRETVGAGWDPALRIIMDWDIYLGMAAAGARFKHLRYPMAAFRVHPQQVTSAPFSRFSEEHARVRLRHGNAPRLTRAATVAGDATHAMLKIGQGTGRLEKRVASLAGVRLLDEDGSVLANAWQQLLLAYRL